MLNNALTNLGDLSWQDYLVFLTAKLQREGLLTSDFTCMRPSTGEDFINPQTYYVKAVISPKGIVYPLPDGMAAQLALATTHTQVAQLIFDYRKAKVYSLETSKSGDFQHYCIALSGNRNMKQDSVYRALYKLYYE